MNVSTGWGRGLALLGALAILIYLYVALFIPGTLQYSPFTIQDDARQFQSWMPGLVDPSLLRGDLIAAYWRDVSPPVYRAPFIAAAAVGMDPLLLGRLLPALLLAVSLWAAWRLALKINADRRVAFFAAAFCFAYLLHDDSIFSATPRAFSAPLLLLALNALQGGRRWLTVALLTLLAAIYPTTAIVGFGILGLSQLRRGERLPLVLPRRSIPVLSVGAAAIVLAAVPLQSGADAWGPVVTLDQALDMPNMNRPEGRSSIVDENGRIAWICSARMGYLPEAVPCGWGIPGAIPINALLLVPLIILAIRSARGKPDARTGECNRVYLWALIACTVCFTIAALVAFRLHFPGRYTQRILGPLEWLAIGQMLGGWLLAKSNVWRGAFIALLVVLAATPLPGFTRPTDAGLLYYIRQLPAEARLSGVSEQLDMVPALTGRAITAAPEQAIPWHMGYYGPFEAGLRRSLELVSTPDRQRMRALIDADYVLVDRVVLERSLLPERYAQVVPGPARQAQRSLAEGPSALQRVASQCAVYRASSAWLLDGRCLARD